MVIIKHLAKRLLFPVIIITFIPIGFYFEPEIVKVIPKYTATTFFSGVLFFTGLSFYLFSRNPVVLLVTVLSTVSLPWLIKWLVNDWPN